MDSDKMCDIVWKCLERVDDRVSGEQWDEICLGLEEIAAAAEVDSADALRVLDAAWKDIEKGHLATIASRDVELETLRERLEEFVDTFAKYLSLPPYEDESPALAGTTHMLICHRKAKELLAATPKRAVFLERGLIHGLTYGEKGRRLRVVNSDRMQLNIYETLDDIADGSFVTVAVMEG